MKNIVCVFLLLIFESLTCSLFAQCSKWDGKSVNTTWYDPNADFEGDTVRLKSASEFAGFNRLVSRGITFKNCVVILDVDIDLDGNEWSSIGLSDDQLYETSFEGVFNGRNHKISGYKSDNGLFTRLGNGGVISNLSIDGLIQRCPIQDGGEYVGTIVSKMEEGSIVSSCISNVAIEVIGSGEYYQPSLRYGGIVGRACGIVRYCRVNSPIVIKGINSFSNSPNGLVATISVGGISGYSDSSCLHDNEFRDSIYCQAGSFMRNIGGITGFCTNSEIRNCGFYGKIESGPKYAKDVHIGGICGYTKKDLFSNSSVFEDCLAVGEPCSIQSNTEHDNNYNVYMGGICGHSMGDISIKNCYFQNNILSINEHVTVTELGTGSDHLFGVTQLNGFSKQHWLFSDMNYPRLREFPEEIICELINPPSFEKWMVGDKCIPSVKIYPEDAYQSYEIFTPDTTMVDIKDNVVTFKKGGDVKLICSTINGIDASFNMNVISPIDSIKFSSGLYTINKGDSLSLSLKILPEDGNEDLYWISSEPNIVSVDNNGMVKGLNWGQSKISVSTSSGVFAHCYVRVYFESGHILRDGDWEYTVISNNPKGLAVSKYSGQDSILYVPSHVTVSTTEEGTTNDFQVVKINAHTFANNVNIKECELPITLESIGEEAFFNCTNLKNLVIPDNVKDIESKAFYNCSNLTYVNLGLCLKYIGTLAYYGCNRLKAVLCQSYEPPYVFLGDQSYFPNNKDMHLFVPIGMLDEYMHSKWTGFWFESITGTDFIERVELGEKEITISSNSSYKFNSRIEPTYLGLDWYFSSNNEEVVKTEGMGEIFGLKEGTATVTLSVPFYGLSAECIVHVKIPVESLTFSTTELSMVEGTSFQIETKIMPENATDKALLWSSSDESIVTVDSEGNVTAMALGEADITATATDGSGVSVTCHVTVIPKLINSVELTPDNWSGHVGELFIIQATVLPENAINKTLLWLSSNESVATVDSEGNVTAVALGEADITATAIDGSGVKATCHVAVLPVLVESIVLTPDSWSGEEGMTFQIDASVLPDSATDKKLRWTSSDKAVAIVDEDGFVAVLKEGTCVITATATDGSGIYAECIITSLAGIDEIFTDGETSWNVYDINGALLRKNCDKEDLKLLSSGIYILQSGSKIIKMIIR